MTLVHWAADRNHLSLARELLARKADPNLKNEDGETPLYLACMAEHKDMARLLLEDGANLALIDLTEEPEMKEWLQVQGLLP